MTGMDEADRKTLLPVRILTRPSRKPYSIAWPLSPEDTLEPFVGGSFPALQFNPSQKPFVVFGIVSKAGAHTCVKRAFENKKLALGS